MEDLYMRIKKVLQLFTQVCTIFVCVCACARAHVCMCMCVCTHVHVRMCVFIHSNIATHTIRTSYVAKALIISNYSPIICSPVAIIVMHTQLAGFLLYSYQVILCVMLLDEIPQDEEHIYISLPLFIVYTIIAIFGIIFAVVCLVINLWLRNKR